MVIKMNDNLIGIQISKFRKAAGMTQEGLGVTIDALFGRDGSERVDVEDVVGSWLHLSNICLTMGLAYRRWDIWKRVFLTWVMG